MNTPKSTKNPCSGSLHWQLLTLAKQVAQSQDEALREHGLDLRRYVTLLRLASTPCGNQLHLAQQSAIDKSTMVAILDALESESLIVRTPDPQDRRARVITLTPAGSQKLQAARQSVQQCEARVLGPLPPSDREAFVRHLATLSASVMVKPPPQQ